MEIAKAKHKVYLWKLFHNATPSGYEEKKFPLSQLVDAANTVKKLMAGSEKLDTGTAFSEEAVEFTIDEAKILKDLLDGIKEASISESEIITELKELLK